MANYNQPEGQTWQDIASANRPQLSNRYSSVSDMSSTGSHRDSMVSLPSPPSESQRFSPYEEVDVSHVRLYSSGGNSGVASLTNSPATYGSSSSLPGLRTGQNGTSQQGFGESARSTPTTPSTRGFNPFNRSPSVSYEPVGRGDGPSRKPSSRRNTARRKNSILGFGHSAIPEADEIGLNLLDSASSMGFVNHNTAYVSLAEDDREDEPLSPLGDASFDISSFGGPIPETELREIEKKERSGILTRGLGAGWVPDKTMTSSDLYATSSYSPVTPTSPPGISRMLSRGMSFRNPGLVRAPTLRHLGQIEANKRGKIIEVVVEDETAVDLSSIAGGKAPDPVADLTTFDPKSVSKQSRQGTLAPSVEVFYPQANWRPFSMTWPYLSALIIISVGLAAVEEYLLQKSMNEKGLYNFRDIDKVNTWDYFSFKYLPTLCAVSFGVVWQITDFEVKRLEAFYQLSKEGGALAAESINVDYITFFNFLRPIRALRYKHYAVAVSSLATLMAVSLVPTLQSASVKLKHSEENNDISVIIDPLFSRILSGILVFIAILGCVLLWQLTRRRSGLVADVKGIAGIAAMANRSHILMDFKNMDTATPEMIHKKLNTHRYLLRNSSLAPDAKVPLTQEEKDKYDTVTFAHNPHPLMLRLIAAIPFVIGIILFMAFIPIVLFQKNANILTEKAPWLLTVLAVCVKLGWGTLETDVRMIEPFYILSKRHASPKVLTLDYTAMAFGWMPIRAFSNGHYLVGAVGLGSVLAELLTVCCTSFANSDGMAFAREAFDKDKHKPDPDINVNKGEETVKSFLISFGLAMLILSFLFSVAVTVFTRRRHPFLPRQPNTISSVLAFIHQSKMLYDFVGTEKMNNDEMVKRLVGIKKTYGLGWFTGRDGELHCGVDEEELVSNYRHGEDTRKAMISSNVGDWQNY